MDTWNERAVVGCLLGTAVGDALGLPLEGLSPARGIGFYPSLDRHHLLPGRGMMSDDTEHACFVAQALLRSGNDPQRFERELSRSLRWWLLSLPPAIGFGTLLACIKLVVGFSSPRSGVDSAGNGPAMRSPLLGVVWGHDRKMLREWVRRSTRITHSNERAYQGALVVAVAAHMSATARGINGRDFIGRLREVLDGDDPFHFISMIEAAQESARRKERVSNLALRLGSGQGISGHIEHTVPCVIQVWLRYPDDYRAAVEEIIRAGGDTDTTAAILGAIIGARQGPRGIPRGWLAGVKDWPRSVGWIHKLGQALVLRLNGRRARVPGYAWFMLPVRNLFLLAVVLLHLLRRLLPPYP